MPKITKRLVDAPHAKERRYVVWDSDVKGFGLLVLPSGVRSFFFRYRNSDGVERRITIGKHSGSLTPDQARKDAERLQRLAKGGRDPLSEKRDRARAATVADVLDAYVDSQRFKEKAQSTQSINLGRIERHLKPLLARKRADALTPGEIERAFSNIRDGKTAAVIKTEKRGGLARVTGGEATARDTIRLLRAVLNWAVAEGLVKKNAAIGVNLGSHNTRDIIIETAPDYARLFETLSRLEAERRIRTTVADAIRTIALTGARKGEIVGARWRHVDLKRGVLTYPKAAHKTGRATGKPRIIALPATAQAIVARQPPGDDEDYVFRPASGLGPLSLTKPWKVLCRAAEMPAGLGLHGLRHSLASHLAMAGACSSELMVTLGHQQVGTTMRYVHFAESARQALAERAAAVALAGLSAVDSSDEAPDLSKPEKSRGQQ